MTFLLNLKNKLLINPIFNYAITVSIIFFLESINTHPMVYIGQNVFFLLNIARICFAALICIRTKEYNDIKAINNRVNNASIIFGVLSFVSLTDCLVSAFSTIFSFYGFAEIYIWVVIIEHLLFFIGVLFLQMYRDKGVAFWVLVHAIQLTIYAVMNIVYFVEKYQSDKQNWFRYFIFTSAIVLIVHLFYSYDLGIIYMPEEELEIDRKD